MRELKWIKHDGGPMPVPGDTLVKVLFRHETPENCQSQPTLAEDWYWIWATFSGSCDITHYAIVGDAVADAVNSPAHYTSGDIECIDAIKAQMSADEFAGHLRGNVVKYMWRYRDKGGVESLEKARWYLERLIGELRA